MSLPELARSVRSLDLGAVAHIQALVAEWGILADLCFADLLLWSPDEFDDERFKVLSHIRPTTNQTIYRSDFTGEIASAVERPLVARAFRSGKILEGEIYHSARQEAVRVLAIPVRHDGRVVVVLSRESAPSMEREPGDLEKTYVGIFDRFAGMIARGEFPYPAHDREAEFVPRVGDGVILLGPNGVVEFTSPNAVSALMRLGVAGSPEGFRLSDLGVDSLPVRRAYVTKRPVTEEVEALEATIVLKCLPLLDAGDVTGGLVTIRDVSDLRHRDRLLMSKDATIREIHHRVKNNLQTISSLLRLQGRRLRLPEAKAAVEESVQRIRSIALVHETLSHEAGEDVAFLNIVRSLIRMVEEGYSSDERPVRFEITGDPGKLPAVAATPVAVVLTELLQNVVDHAYPEGGGQDATATVELANGRDQMTMRVLDGGVGLDTEFSIEESAGLGLQIVRTLVETDLEGTISMRPRDGEKGTVVEVKVPLPVGA